MTALELAQMREYVEDRLRHYMWEQVAVCYDAEMHEHCTMLMRALLDLDAMIASTQRMIAERAQHGYDGPELVS